MSIVIVKTTAGCLRGLEVDGVTTFKGVRYGASPAGPGRFRAPAALEPWHGERDAFEFGPSCPQSPLRPKGWAREARESEDCLALNVWTPKVDDAGRRPIMVWLHGGGYAIGSGSWPLYDGASLSRRGDVVVVTVNHRLGVLGFLHLGEIAGAEFATSPNAGMLDIVAALQWVRDNAETFGGDAGNVTMFGESGGGAKITTLLAMPAARGLFHRAAIQSGPGLWVRSMQSATKTAEKLIDEVGLGPDDLDELWRMPVGWLVASRMGRKVGRGGFSPVLDGHVIPVQPGDALADGTAADVPVLIGSNQDEASMGLQSLLAKPSLLDDDGLRERLDVYGEHAGSLLATYRRERPAASPADLLLAIQSDAFHRMGSVTLAELKLAGSRTPVFMYQFRWATGRLRSGHGHEIPFVFDNVGSASSSRVLLASQMSEAWIAFAREGEPGHPGIPDWPAYRLPERATMIFDRGSCVVESDPRGPEREAWAGVGVAAPGR